MDTLRWTLIHAAAALAKHLDYQEIEVEERWPTKCALLFASYPHAASAEFLGQLTFDDLEGLYRFRNHDNAHAVLHAMSRHETGGSRYRFSIFKGGDGKLWGGDYSGQWPVLAQGPDDSDSDPSPR